MADVELTKYEQHLFKLARAGDYTPFTSHFFQLEWSGTWYTPEDHVEVYERLHAVWTAMGKPDETFQADLADGRSVTYKLMWGNYGNDPEFLYPHGYVLLPWTQKMLRAGKLIAIVEGGTGAAKTSGIGVSMMMMCALYPGFDAGNVGPTSFQSNQMLDEQLKWATNTEFEKFVVPTRSGELFRWRPHPTMTVDCGLGSYSTFTCQTLGGEVGNISGNSILGTGKDWLNIDEAALIYDIEESLARLATRYRGSRRTGVPRRSRPAFSAISNPHVNGQWEQLKAQAEEDPKRYFYARPHRDENIYITAQQKELHSTLLSGAQQERWVKGSDQTYRELGVIPLPLIEGCTSPALDQLIEDHRKGGGLVEIDELMGLLRYQLPAEEGHEYLVFWDPGTANPVSLNINNVPVVGAWDVTQFPKKAAQLVCLHVLHGHGKYGPSIECVREMMLFYHAVAAYDGTGMGKVMNEWPELAQLPLYRVSLSGNNKATAKVMFLLFAGNGLLAWPYLKTLYHQARVYRETGSGIANLPDDVLAGMFVSAFYMRAAFWHGLADLFHWEEEPEEAEDRSDHKPRRDRYGRRTGRYKRRIPARPLAEGDSDFARRRD